MMLTPAPGLFEAVGARTDDLPPPAYRPQPEPAPRPAVSSSLRQQDDASAFVAPRPRAPGTPSPEALARLQAAVSKTPAQSTQRPQAQTARPAAAAPAAKPAADRPRFGIGSLINRMSGGHAEPGAERPQPARHQPTMSAYDDEQDMTPDQERNDIPAFLRRQAN